MSLGAPHVDPGALAVLDVNARAAHVGEDILRDGRAVRAVHGDPALLAKLDEAKNSDEVAYDFFRYMMSLDLSGFTVEEVFQTELHKEQKSHNECAVKQFLQAVKCGEYPCRFPLEDRWSTHTPYTFTCLQLMAHFREFVRRSGLSSNVDSM